MLELCQHRQLTLITTVKAGHELLCKASVEYQTKKCDWIVLEDTEGNLPKIRNAALALVKTPWYAFIDADDVLYANAVELITKKIAEIDTNVSHVYSYCDNDAKAHTPYRPSILLDIFVAFHLCAIRTGAVKALGGYNEFFRWQSDYDLALRAEEEGWGFECLPLTLYKYNLSYLGRQGSYDTKREYFVQQARQQAIMRRMDKKLYHLLPE